MAQTSELQSTVTEGSQQQKHETASRMTSSQAEENDGCLRSAPPYTVLVLSPGKGAMHPR